MQNPSTAIEYKVHAAAGFIKCVQ